MMASDDAPPPLEDFEDVMPSIRGALADASTSGTHTRTHTGPHTHAVSATDTGVVGATAAADAEEPALLQQMQEAAARKAAEKRGAAASRAPGSAVGATGTHTGPSGGPAAGVAHATEAGVSTASSKPAAKSSGGGGGGGLFKKGFLLGNSSGGKKPAAAATPAPSKASAEPDIVITTAHAAKSSPLVMPEVQRAMESSTPMLQQLQKDTSWMTPDLLARVAKDPKLMAGMANPRYMAALAEFQKNAKVAMEKYKDDEGVKEFMQGFMRLMGEHFEKLGEKQDAEKVSRASAPTAAPEPAAAIGLAASSTRRIAGSSETTSAADKVGPSAAPSKPAGSKSSQASPLPAQLGEHLDSVVRAAQEKRIATEDEEVREVLANRALMTVLQDPRMQYVMEDCRRDGSRLRYYMGIPEVREKLLMLQKAGLIRLEV